MTGKLAAASGLRPFYIKSELLLILSNQGGIPSSPPIKIRLFIASHTRTHQYIRAAACGELMRLHDTAYGNLSWAVT